MATQPPLLRKLLILLGGVSAIVLVIILSFRLWIQPLVDQAVQLGLSQLHEQGYQVNYQKLKFHPLRREIVLRGASVSVDTAQVAGNYFTGELAELKIKLNQYPYWETDRFLAIQQIHLQNPVIRLHSSDTIYQTDESSKPLSYYALIQPFLDSLSIESIRIENGQLKQALSQKIRDTLVVSGINIALTDLYLDSLRSSTNQGLPTLASFNISLDSVRQMSKDSLYAFSVGAVEVDVLDKTIHIQDFQVQPTFNKDELITLFDQQHNQFAAKISSLKVTGIQLNQWVKSTQLRAQRISVDSAHLAIFKDKRLLQNRAVKPLLQTMLQSVPLAFQVDTIIVQASQIEYEERNGLSNRSGRISFDRLYASLYGATNIFSSQNTFEANIRAAFMNAGIFDLSLRVPLNSEQGYHQIRGELSQMHLDKLNPFLEPVAFASVKSGMLNKLTFEINADERISTGKAYFIYDDLKISLVNQEHPKNPAIREMLGTWVANWFVVKTDNPTRNQPLRVGQIYYERDPGRSVFSYWCYSLLSGLKASIGLSKPGEVTASTQAITKEEERPGLIKRIFKKSKN